MLESPPGVVLLLFELVIVLHGRRTRLACCPRRAAGGLDQARRITDGITEPGNGPVRRVLKPARARVRLR